MQGFKSVRVVKRAKNYGLAKNLTQGISEVLSHYDAIIVVEDDIVVGRYFLRFLNDALACYRGHPQVGSISGYAYPVTQVMPETYFYPRRRLLGLGDMARSVERIQPGWPHFIE